MKGVAFLAPRGPLEEIALRSVAATALTNDAYVDLDLDPSFRLEVLARLSEQEAARIVRLLVRVPLKDLPRTAGALKAYSMISKRVVARLTFRTRLVGSDLAPILEFLDAERLAGEKFDLVVDAGSELDLSRLRQAADDAGVNVRIPGVARISSGKPLDMLGPWNVLQASLRALFRQRPTLCPFPFVMLRWSIQDSIHLCPVDSGPTTRSWNDPESLAVRHAFFEGETPEKCRGCTLLPHVQRGLAEPEAKPDPPRPRDFSV